MTMQRLKYWLLTVFSSFLLHQHAGAQSVYAQVSNKRVQVGMPFEYAIVISVGANNYTPPSFKDFEVISGPNQSSSVQYVNGVMSQQMIISFHLVPKKEGKFTIGPAYVNSGNQRYEAAAVTVEVVKGAPQNETQNNKITGEDVFIRTTVSKNKCYLGEQVTIVQKVYSRHQITSYQKSALPAYNGFYSQAQESPTKGQLLMENYDGVNYYTHEVFRTVATPNKTGRVTIEPIEVTPVIRRQSKTGPKNIFEQFFGASGYEDIPVTVKSRAQVVEVMPLPEEGKPENFSGAVGYFTYRVETSRTELKANDAFNLKLTISGKGNIKLLSPPKLNLPESFETYEPKQNEAGSSKSFDYLVIPREQGEFRLDQLDFSFFNVETKKYITLPGGEIIIKVLPPDPNSAGAEVYSQQNLVKETENDIRYIKKGDFPLLKSSTEFFNSTTHIVLIFLAILGLFLSLFMRRNYLRNNSDLVLVKERRAAGMAKKQLVNAEKQMNANNKDVFYSEVLTALNNYLSFKLNIPVADLSRERILSTLSKKGVDENLRVKLDSTLGNCEYARYAPGAVSGDLQSVYRDTAGLITGLEQQLNKKS